MSVENQKKKESQNLADLISYLLFGAGIFNFISCIVWACSQDHTDKWFTRQCLSFVCFGLSGIIFRLKK